VIYLLKHPYAAAGDLDSCNFKRITTKKLAPLTRITRSGRPEQSGASTISYMKETYFKLGLNFHKGIQLQ
jgi:hypothetical protein